MRVCELRCLELEFVYRFPSGGVSMSYASYDSSVAYTYIGSRLAFRGRLVKASSAVAFKAISEVA